MGGRQAGEAPPLRTQPRRAELARNASTQAREVAHAPLCFPLLWQRRGVPARNKTTISVLEPQPSKQDAYELRMTVSCKNPFILSVPDNCMNHQMQKEKEMVADCSFTAGLENILAKQESESPLNQGGKHNLGLRGKISPKPLMWRTPQAARRSCNASFKSPVLPPRSCQPADKDILQHEIEELKRKELAVDQEIAQIKTEGYNLEELENHITLLHEYNEIKDTGQMLLGRLAAIRGVTTKDLYPEFDLDLND